MAQTRLQEQIYSKSSPLVLALIVLLCNQTFADESASSESAKTTAVSKSTEEPEPFNVEVIRSKNAGGLKPAIYSETVWAPANKAKTVSTGVTQASGAIQSEIPPPPEVLAAPVTAAPIVTDPIVVEPSPSNVEVIEPNVDIRLPQGKSNSTENDEDDDKDIVDPCWTDPFVDDHLYLWRENREGLELLFGNGSGFGMTTLGFDAKIIAGDGPLWANFKFGWHFLDGPLQPDIRSQTYDLSLEINHAMQINETWGLHLQLAPTWATDWDNKTGDAFRLIGGGLISMKYAEGVTFLLGAMALDRPDLPVVPTVGVRIFGDELELDLVIPRPRIAWKLNEDNNQESWFYVAGELGGGSWAVERELSRKEIMSYRDLRLLVGWEDKKVDGTRHVFELGWVFDRQLEFDRFGGSRDLGETFLIRWGKTY